MKKYAIIVIAYNRDKCLQRLLNSLNEADYGVDQVPLIISIDYNNNMAVKRIAETFQWKHGEKYIRQFQEKQGLRRHILQCGDYLQQYDAIAVFEDDLYVAPGFYQFMKEAVPVYEQDDRIAGISLYTHRWNVVADRQFEPLRKEEDVFFMQFAQSWGQIWMKRQWCAFREWYDSRSETDVKQILCMDVIPRAVRMWPETSWLKYHIAYCIINNKYFVYPYDSLTTNGSDAGEHSRKATWRYQVPMQMGIKKDYRLPMLDNDSVRYDSFFESQNMASYLELEESDLCVDLYGSKPGNMGKKYWLTNNRITGQKIKSEFGLVLRPMEVNIWRNISGEDFVLYEMMEKEVRVPEKKIGMREIDYDIRGEGMSLKNVLAWVKYRLIHR